MSKKMEYFRNNIKFLRKRKNRTQDDVAIALGFKRSTLSGYENGIAEPSLSSITRFSDYYGVAIDTLVKVDLSSLRESQLSQLERGHDVYIKGSKLRVLATTVDMNNNENIELVNEKAKAGYTTGFADPEYIKELPVFQMPFLSSQKKYRTFQVKGDSMLPVPEGAWITGEYIQDWQVLKNGDACIILTIDEGVVFKIIENNLQADKGFTLHSLNPLYKSYEVNVSNIKEIWKFVHFISEDLPDYNLSREFLLSTIMELEEELDKVKTKLSTGKNIT